MVLLLLEIPYKEEDEIDRSLFVSYREGECVPGGIISCQQVTTKTLEGCHLDEREIHEKQLTRC